MYEKITNLLKKFSKTMWFWALVIWTIISIPISFGYSDNTFVMFLITLLMGYMFILFFPAIGLILTFIFKKISNNQYVIKLKNLISPKFLLFLDIFKGLGLITGNLIQTILVVIIALGGIALVIYLLFAFPLQVIAIILLLILFVLLAK